MSSSELPEGRGSEHFGADLTHLRWRRLREVIVQDRRLEPDCYRGWSLRRAVSGLGLLALLLQGCSLAGLERAVGVSAVVRGEMRVRGVQSTEWTLRPEACISGDRGNFRGVDLLAPPLVLRVAVEPIDGLALAVIDTDSGERRGIFRRADCPTLRGDVQRTGWRINEVADVSGFVEVDCRLPSGVEIAGSIAFEHCH